MATWLRIVALCVVVAGFCVFCVIVERMPRRNPPTRFFAGLIFSIIVMGGSIAVLAHSS